MKKAVNKRKESLFSFLRKGLLFLAIFSAGGTVSGFYFQRQPKPSITISGFPILKQKGYTMAYDGRCRVPLWTYEHLTKKQLIKNVDRKSMHFCENTQIYPPHRSTLTDYYKSGYDRGHMIPARDQQVNQENLKETFLLSNVCPQNPELNRGYWKKLEEYTRKQVPDNESVEVISGPLYLPQVEGDQKIVSYQVIGPNNVAVPTHFYKVILLNAKRGNPQVSAYIIPNSPVNTQTPFQEYEVPLLEIEKATGLVFKTSKPIEKSVVAMLQDAI